jgi:uncharacterized protein YjdB
MPLLLRPVRGPARRPVRRRGARLSCVRGARTLVGAALALASVGAACGDASGARDPVARVELTPDAVALPVGADAPLTARLLDPDGRDVAGRSVVWTTRDASVAEVVPSAGLVGIVRGRGPGTTQVAANVEGRFATATIVVSRRTVALVELNPNPVALRVGGTALLRVRALDATGAELGVSPPTFASSDTTVATVTPAGLVTGVRPGGATIIVAVEQLQVVAAVTVTPLPTASVTLVPGDTTLLVGATLQYAATALDSAGRPLAGRPAAWTSSDEQVARVSSTGLATAVGPGTARIAVTIEGRTATRALTVRARPVAALALAAPRTTLTVGDTVPLAVRVSDAEGNALADRPVRFESEAPGVAAVSATGVVTAVAPGSATIVATSEGVRGTLTLRVVAVPVASVGVTPGAVEATVGDTVRLTATPRAADGAPLAGARSSGAAARRAS